MAEKYNICIDANATWIRQFTWLDAFNNPIDLTNYTVNSQIRVIATSPTASATFESTIIDPPASGTFTLTLAPSQSLALTGSCYVYDILCSSGSYAFRLLEGKATIDNAVTR